MKQKRLNPFLGYTGVLERFREYTMRVRKLLSPSEPVRNLGDRNTVIGI